MKNALSYGSLQPQESGQQHPLSAVRLREENQMLVAHLLAVVLLSQLVMLHQLSKRTILIRRH